MSAVKRIARNTFYVLSGRILSKAISVVFIAYSARLLGAEAYGIFVLVTTMTLIASTFTNFGIRAMVVRKMSQDKTEAEPVLSNILAIRSLLAVLVYLGLCVFVNLAGYPREVISLVYIGALVIFCNIYIDSFETVYIAFERMKLWGAFMVASSLGFTTLALAALASGFWLKAVFTVNVAVAAAIAVLSGLVIRKRFFHFRPRLDSAYAKEIAWHSLPFLLALVLNTLNTKVDIMMLSLVDGPMEGSLAIGYYAPAHNILLALMILPRSLSMAMLPAVSQKIHTDPEFVRMSVEKATRFTMVTLSFPIILASTFFAREIVGLVFGPKYLASAPVLTILGWAYAFFALTRPVQSVLGSSREMKQYLPLMFILLLLNIVLNALLIPTHSYLGASVSTCVSLILGFLGRFYFLRRTVETKRSELTGYARLFGVLGATLGFAFLLKGHVPWYALAGTIVLSYPAFIYLLRGLDRDERAALVRFLNRRLSGAS